MDELWWKVMIGSAGIMTIVAGFIASLFYRQRENMRHEREKFSLTEESERRYRDLFDNVTDLIYLHSPEGEIIDINEMTLKLLGYQVGEVKGHRIEEFVLPQERTRLRAYLEKAANGDVVLSGLFPVLSKSRKQLHILEYKSSPVISAGRMVAIRGVARDVTDRVRYERLRVRHEQRMETLLENAREMQSALTHLTGELMMIQERERAAISRELHDEISQIIATITMNLETIRSDVSPSRKKLLKRIEGTQDLTSHVLQRIREVLRDLKPLGLDPVGIVPALQTLGHDFRDRSGATIELLIDPRTEGIPLDEKIALYRIVQESLTNAWRHGRAEHVTLQTTCIKGMLTLEITDDGAGFDVGPGFLPRNGARGLGLLGMRERVRLYDGEFSVSSRVGKGTTIRVMIPVKPSNLERIHS